MTMQPFTTATEGTLRLLWRRGGPKARFVDLGDMDLRQIRRAVQLGLVESRQIRDRNKARLTPTGRYFARLVTEATSVAEPARRF